MTNSIAIVVLDAVRNDYFRKYFDWIPGQYYEQAYSTSHWTIPSHASLLTGLLPRETGTYAGSPSFVPPIQSLPKQLQKAGYKTRLYTQNIQLVQWEGWTAGFDEVVGPEIDGRINTFNWRDASINAQMSGILRYPEAFLLCLLSDSPTFPSIREGWKIFSSESGSTSATELRFKDRSDKNSKEFVLFNLMDAHSSSGRTTVSAISEGVSEPNKLSKNYEEAVSKLSESFKSLFKYLYSEFNWVITLSDHGELLGEYNLSGHGYGIYPELVKIPLVISSQGNTCAHSTDNLVSLLDIASTVRDIAGIEQIGRGSSLLNNKKVRQKAPVERLGQPHLHEEAFRRYNIYSKFQKYNIPLKGVAVNKKGYIYETESETESTDEWQIDEKEEINKVFDGIETYVSKDSIAEAPDDVKERLKDLGYG